MVISQYLYRFGEYKKNKSTSKRGLLLFSKYIRIKTAYLRFLPVLPRFIVFFATRRLVVFFAVRCLVVRLAVFLVVFFAVVRRLLVIVFLAMLRRLVDLRFIVFLAEDFFMLGRFFIVIYYLVIDLR